MRLIWLCLLLGLLAGCEKSKKPTTGPLPTIAVPIVDPEPIEQSVDKAHASAVKAKDGLDDALSKPAGPETVGKVSTARNDVGSTVAELENAKNVIIPKLKIELEAAKSAVKTNQANCDKAVSEKDQTIAEQQEEIKKLKDENLNKTKTTLRWVGILLLLLGAAGPIASFVWQVPFGWKIGALAFPLGAVALTLSLNLDKIVWWTEIALSVFVGGGVIVAAIFGYHLLHHPSPTLQGPPETVELPPNV